MKVVHISSSDMGGAGIAAKRLHLASLAAGIDSTMLTLQKSGEQIPRHFLANESDTSSLLNKAGKRIIGSFRYRMPALFPDLDNKLIGRPEGYDLFSFPVGMKGLWKHPAIEQSDLIHLHWVSGGFLDYADFFKNIRQPVVWTLHDMNPFTGGCHHADGSLGFMGDCSACKQLVGARDQSAAGKNLAVKLRSLAGFDSRRMHIVCPSRWLKELSLSSRLFGRFEHSVIPNTVDPSIFCIQDRFKARAEFGIEAEAKVVLFVANDVHNHRKGIGVLLQALHHARVAGLVVLAVGKKMHHSGLTENIRQMGLITSETQMAKLYSLANVYVLPSMAENFPNTIAEAHLCGLPVIASNVGGIPEQLDEENGTLISPGSEGDLLAAIRKLILTHDFDPELIRQKAVKKYSPGNVVSAYQETYLRVLQY